MLSQEKREEMIRAAGEYRPVTYHTGLALYRRVRKYSKYHKNILWKDSVNIQRARLTFREACMLKRFIRERYNNAS